MKKNIILLTLLVIFDELIKVFINFCFIKIRIKILDGRIGFVPYINKDQISIWNHELNLHISNTILLVFNVIGLSVLIIIYLYVKNREYTNNYYEIAFLLISAGVICSFIDTLLYGGSLDYILLLRHIYDIKDIYLFLGVIFIFIYFFSYLNSIKMKKSKS